MAEAAENNNDNDLRHTADDTRAHEGGDVQGDCEGGNATKPASRAMLQRKMQQYGLTASVEEAPAGGLLEVQREMLKGLV